MSTSTVHVAVFDTFADWEVGYATAHIRSRNWQREPGRYSITTVGPTREPVTTMGGMRIMPGIALDELRPEDSAMLILAGGDTWGEDSMAGFAPPRGGSWRPACPSPRSAARRSGSPWRGCLTTARTRATRLSIWRSPDMPAVTGSSPSPRWWTGT